MDKMIKYASISKVKSVDDDKQIIEFVATKEIMDYDGDIVKVAGINIGPIKQNRSFLWSHRQADFPPGKILGLKKDGIYLKGKAQLVKDPKYTDGTFLYKLMDEKYVNNISISFLPDYDSIERKALKNGKTVSIIHKCILLEISAVNIGCNPGTSIAVKDFRKGLNKAWEDDVIDGTDLYKAEEMLDKIEDEATKEWEIEDGVIYTKKESLDTNTEGVNYEKEITDLKEEMEKLKDKSYIHGMFDGYKKSSEEKIYEELGDMKDSKEEMYNEIAKIIKGV